MTEKVKLPKDVCDIFNQVLNCAIPMLPSDLFLEIATGAVTPKMYIAIKDIDLETIMRALVLGYEPEMTAEEQIKERYENRGDFCTYEHFLGYRDGVKDALHLHGIKYDWIKGWGEDDAE